MRHSGSSTTFMFWGNGIGEFIPPMIICESENLYKIWVTGGPKDAICHISPSGWFDNRTFEI